MSDADLSKLKMLDTGHLIPGDWVEINLEAEFGRHFISGTLPVVNVWKVEWADKPSSGISPPRTLKPKTQP